MGSPHEPVGLVAAAGAAESVAEPAVGGVMTATVAGVAAAVGVVLNGTVPVFVDFISMS